MEGVPSEIYKFEKTVLWVLYHHLQIRISMALTSHSFKMNPTTPSSHISSDSPKLLISPPHAFLTTTFHNHSVAPLEHIHQSETHSWK